ncbi:sulfatase, partial [Planctomycetota bacterium]
PETAVDAKQLTSTSDRDPGFARERSMGTLTVGKLPDHHTTAKAIEWVTQQAKEDKPFFLSMNLQSSHFPYLVPKGAEKPFQPCELDSSIGFVNYAESDVPRVKNAYFNAIHECDNQVGRLVDALRRNGQLEKTILIVTGENGEAFHECGGSVTHAREPVEPAIHVACVFHAPGLLEPRVDDYPLEHVDLVPTICGLLGMTERPNFQGIDVLAAERIPSERRLIFNHVNSCLAQCDAVVLGGRWKLTTNRLENFATLFDVQRDPNQEVNLFHKRNDLAQALQERLETWRSQQLSYYHFPQYYLNFYAPKPPTWNLDSTTSFVSTEDTKSSVIRTDKQ